MATNTSFVLLIFFTLSVARVHCFVNVSSPRSNPSSTAIDNITSMWWTDTKNKASIDPVPSQSNFNLKAQKNNRAECCRDELNGKFAGPGIFKLNRLLPGFITKSSPSYTLNLNNHGLDGLIPGAFEELEGLKGLVLDNKNLASLNASTFQGLQSLETLKIDMKNLSSLPNDVFLYLINLKKITLNANNFSSLPADLFVHNKKLKTVELKQNKVNMADLPAKFFSDFVDLEVVLLQSIGLQQLSEDLFWNSYKLKKVDLSKNYLKTLPKNLLRDALELRTLNLSSNHLTTLPNGLFTSANQLDQLDLSGNYITALNKWDIFVGLNSLQIINMERNNLEMIHPDAFISLPNLKIANFAHNHLNLTSGLRNLFGQVSAFRHCPLLEDLDLSYNNVSEMYSDWIMEHSLLHRLDLSHNNFIYLDSNDLRFNSSNLYVDLSHNLIKIVNLTELQNIPKNPNASRDVSVNLNYNPIDCYCEVYSLDSYIRRDKESCLKQEDLDYVKFLTDNLSCNAPEEHRGKLLKDIKLESEARYACSASNGRSASCASVGQCDCYIIPSRLVLWIHCGGQNLTEAPTWVIGWNIVWGNINLRNNALREIPDVTLDSYKGIGSIYIDLYNNQIERIGYKNKSFWPHNLHKLNLNRNKITDIDIGLLNRMLPYLIQLSALKNPWHCNNRTLAFRDFARLPLEKRYWYVDLDMQNFTCDINATLVQPSGLQTSGHFTNPDMIVYTSLAVLLLMIVCVVLFIIYPWLQRSLTSPQKINPKHQEAKL